MRDFVIITDSTCDLPQEIMEKLNIKLVPMSITIDDNSYKHYDDYRELSKDDFYQKIRGGFVGTTAGVNSQDAISVMGEALNNNNDVLYLSFSSAMSSSYQSAFMAVLEMQEDFPNANIKLIDTLSACVGQGLLVYLAAMKKAEGASFDEVVEFVENNKLNICHSFMVDDLMYLEKSGRTSHLSAVAGTMLNIKPVFKINNDGKIFLDGKVRGKNAGIKHLLNRAKDKGLDHKIFFIVHADMEEDALILKNQILELFPEAEIIINCIGPIIGNCLGPGALAVAFVGDNR